MKVLYLHQHFSTPLGATGTRSYEMARRLLERGHQVTMICGSYGSAHSGINQAFKNGRRSAEVDGIKVIELELPYSNSDSFSKRALTFLKFAYRSIRIALREPFDLIFATSTPLTAGIPGIFAKWFRGKPFIFEVRDLWPELPKAMKVITNPVILALMSVLEWVSYYSADACIALSPGILQGIKRRSKNGGEISVIPNGCDLRIFPDRSAVQGWRPSEVQPDDFMAVFSGAHGIANGLDAVLDAAVILKQKERNKIKLVFIGEGKLKRNLIEKAKKEELENCIFLDAIPKKKLAGLLSEADLGMMILKNVPAFYYGTSPNKFFDYISSGLPVLNNYPGWLAEMIHEYHCGIVVPPDNPTAFAKAMMYAEGHRDALIEMGYQSRKLAVKKFDRQVLADDFVNLMETVLRDHEAPV
jgi:glycosyltransferase involved in cell wall biosynthesis